MFADTDQLPVVGGVENLELLGVERSVGPELELHQVFFSKLIMRSSSSRLAVEHIGVYGDAQNEVGFILTTGFEDLGEFALDFHAHGDWAFMLPRPLQ